MDKYNIGTMSFKKDGKIYTIEGNASDKCAERMYFFDDAQVMGYGTPKYE